MTTVQSPSPTSHGAHYSALSVVFVPFYTHLRRGLYLIPIWRTKPLWLWNGPANTILPRYSILPTSSAFALILVMLSSVLTLVCIRTFLGTCVILCVHISLYPCRIWVSIWLQHPQVVPIPVCWTLNWNFQDPCAPQSAITSSMDWWPAIYSEPCILPSVVPCLLDMQITAHMFHWVFGYLYAYYPL